MGDWGPNIGESDTFADVYDCFFDHYNSGADSDTATRHVRSELSESFTDHDDTFDAHFALALAQWEIQSLDASLLNEVKGFIVSGADLKNWEERESSEAVLKKRSIALDGFLGKISKPRFSKKRRSKQKFDYSEQILILLPAPDGNKVLSIKETYVNGEYAGTSARLNWTKGGSGIFGARCPDLKYTANWMDSQNLEIGIPKSLEVELKNHPINRLDSVFFCGELVTLHCKYI